METLVNICSLFKNTVLTVEAVVNQLSNNIIKFEKICFTCTCLAVREKIKAASSMKK